MRHDVDVGSLILDSTGFQLAIEVIDAHLYNVVFLHEKHSRINLFTHPCNWSTLIQLIQHPSGDE